MLVLTLLLVFLGTGALLVGAFLFANRRELAAKDNALGRLLGGLGAGAAIEGSILRDQRASDLAFLNRLLSGKGVTDWAARELARAGARRNPGEFLMACVVTAMLGAVVVTRVLPGAVGVLVGMALGGWTPVLLLRREHTQRVKKFEQQLPDALDMLVNSLRAGYSLQAAMEFVGSEVPAPLGPEFARFYDEQRLGVDVREALLRMQERVGTYDVKMFVTALLIQRETGGNLSEVLGSIATLMRERVAFRGEVDTMTSEAKGSAKVLTALPILVFAALYVVSPSFVEPLLTTSTGHQLIALAIGMVVTGYVVLSKIADIDI
jgi:tight adherence protein B